jgi:hypothetical protein
LHYLLRIHACTRVHACFAVHTRLAIQGVTFEGHAVGHLSDDQIA